MLTVPLTSLPLPPSTLRALSAAGLETLADVQEVSPEQLKNDYNVPESMIRALTLSQLPSLKVPLSQSVTSLTQSGGHDKISTQCDPLDTLLGGGLSTGAVLELSGPPGTPKELFAIKICRSFALAKKRVLFVDMQNMNSPSSLKAALGTSYHLASYLKIHSLSRLMVFIHNLSTYLTSHPVSLLVLSSISFPFQTASHLTPQSKNSLQEIIKLSLTKATVSYGVTVITTSQLATKVLNADGSAGTFDTGAKGVMVPLLGSYLPQAKAYRIIISHDSASSGRLLSHSETPLAISTYGPNDLMPHWFTPFRRANP